MDRELPRRTASGIYPPERDGERTFAWTARRAELRLPGLDRRGAWTCSLLFRGGRADPAAQPAVEISADGLTLARPVATNDYQQVDVTIPARPRQPGVAVAIVSSQTLVPGGGDPRELGIQIDRVACRPAGDGLTLPPRAALESAAVSAAVLGASLALCLPPAGAIAALVLLAAGQSLPLASGPAPYGPFAGAASRIAIWIAIVLLVSAKGPELLRKRKLSTAAAFVLVFSCGVLYLKLLGLLHPSKLVIDALFHAHRFQAVLAGNYYFTQIMPGGVTFPYAVGLYAVAAPWAALTRDHVMLLRVVVSATEALAGVLLYLLVVRTWGDRLTAALAVVLFHLVPLPYGLIGNANLTNAFGQSAALVALAVAAAWPPALRPGVKGIALFLLVSLALLSHISTAAQLGVTLLTLAVLYRALGDAALKRSAVAIFAVAVLAAGFSWGVYYGRFTDVYATALERMRPGSAAAAAAQKPEPGATQAAGSRPGQAAGTTTLTGRTGGALALTAAAVGWPVVILAAAGAWQVSRSGARDPLTLLLLAWAVTFAIFFGVGVLPRVQAPFQRYAAEFVGRVVFATYAGAAILAARGAAWGVRGGWAARLAVGACLIWAMAAGAQHWRGWFQ